MFMHTGNYNWFRSQDIGFRGVKSGMKGLLVFDSRKGRMWTVLEESGLLLNYVCVVFEDTNFRDLKQMYSSLES